MRLNNRQIEVIVTKIVKEQENARNIELEKELTNPKLVKEGEKILKTLESLPEWARNYQYRTLKPILFELFRNSGVKLQTVVESYQTIRNKIILATINTTTLDELFTKLNIEQ